MRNSFLPLAFIAIALCAMTLSPQARADARTLVEMPAPMQEHMLGNMRDHLQALDEIFDLLSAGDANGAAAVAEQQLGLSSLNDHGAAHLATFMPQQMQDFGTEMHKAASRFVQAVQDADVERTFAAQQKIFAALHGITAQCNACHASFRIR